MNYSHTEKAIAHCDLRHQGTSNMAHAENIGTQTTLSVTSEDPLFCVVGERHWKAFSVDSFL